MLKSFLGLDYGLPIELRARLQEACSQNERDIDWNVRELASIASVEDAAVRVLLLAASSARSLGHYRTYNDDDPTVINRRELERIAAGRSVLPWIGWPHRLDAARHYVLQYADYEQPLQTAQLCSDDNADDDDGHGWHRLLRSKQLAKVLGGAFLRAGTFPPVLPGHVVYGQVDPSVQSHWDQQFRRLPTLGDDPFVQLYVGIDAGALILGDYHHDDLIMPWLANQLFPPRPEDSDPSAASAVLKIGPKQAGLVLVAGFRHVPLPLPLVYSLLGGTADPVSKAALYAAMAFQPSSSELVNLLMSAMMIGDESRTERQLPTNGLEREAAIFAVGFSRRRSGDRQLMHELFRIVRGEASLTMAAGISLGLVAGTWAVFTDRQLRALINWALGGGSSLYGQFASLLCLMIAARKEDEDDDKVVRGREELACLLETQVHHPDHDSGYVRFVKHFAVLWLRRPSSEHVVCDGDMTVGTSYPWTLAAAVYYLALMNAASVPSDSVLGWTWKVLAECRLQLTSLNPPMDSEDDHRMTFDDRKARLAWLFCRDVTLLALGLLRGGTGDPDVLGALRRHFGDDLSGDFGRSLLHMTSVGLLFPGLGRLTLPPSTPSESIASEQTPPSNDAKEDGLTSLLLATWPLWQPSHTTPAHRLQGDVWGWPIWCRLLWLQGLQPSSCALNVPSDDGMLLLPAHDLLQLSVEQLGLLQHFQDQFKSTNATLWSPLQVELALLCKHCKPALIVS